MSNGKQPKVKKEARDFRRFIEESFPVKEVGEASAREKTIRHGHISTMHAWWARRPLAASRATAYAALTPAPKDAEEWQKKRDFIVQLSQWENSNNQSLLERARREILEANGGVPPKVLDPFSGGGSYPLEAMRLGCDSYANDYNPVAVLVEKATLEFPQKFGRPFEGMPEWAKSIGVSHKSQESKKRGKKKSEEKQMNLLDATSLENTQSEIVNPLLNAVRYWGDWVLEEARKELEGFYPPDPDGNIPVGYIWARTIPCQNPACGQDIPLMGQFWLAKRDKKKVALYPDIHSGKVEFHIVGDGHEEWPKGFDPENGTVSRAVSTCLVCGSVIDDKTTRQLFREEKSNEQLVAVILVGQSSGKIYRVAEEKDKLLFAKTESYLKQKVDSIGFEWGLEPIPDEALPPKQSHRAVGSQLPLYHFVSWGDLFNSRQKLALITFVTIIRSLAPRLEKDNPEFARAVLSYLAINLDRLAVYCTSLGYWHVSGEKASPGMQRQALAMVFDYAETNPLADNFSWSTNLEWVLRALEHCSNMNCSPIDKITNSSATSMPYPNDYFDCILTDPPYYDNVPYSYLSDFFYVWLKRTVGHLYPELFSSPLTPKSTEIVAYNRPDGGLEAGKKFFEDNLKLSFQEIHRILKPDGISVIVYAHKSTEGWETVINALLDSNLVISGAWPIHTEMQARINASETASLASSIYIVARKVPRLPTGFYNDVRTELTQYLDAKLHRLWEEGIGGGDFFIAAIGSAIEVFGKYEQVMDFEGNIVRANRLLEEVRVIATNYAVKQILHDDFATEVSPIARFYVLWRWNYGEALVPFDEANKLAHSCGLDLSLQFGKNGFIKKEKEFARLLGPQGRKLDDLDDPRDMIDVLHKSLLLWEKGQRAEMVKALSDRGFGTSEAFYRVAQAISETLPLESKEKKLLDGFLAGRDRVQQEVEKSAEQGKLL